MPRPQTVMVPDFGEVWLVRNSPWVPRRGTSYWMVLDDTTMVELHGHYSRKDPDRSIRDLGTIIGHVTGTSDKSMLATIGQEMGHWVYYAKDFKEFMLRRTEEIVDALEKQLQKEKRLLYEQRTREPDPRLTQRLVEHTEGKGTRVIDLERPSG